MITRLRTVAILAVLLIFAIPASQASFWETFKSITGQATTGAFNATIDVGNTPPNLSIATTAPTTLDLNENTITIVTVNGTISDADGVANLGSGASVTINFSLVSSSVQSINYGIGTTPRVNTSCRLTDISDLYARNYSCSVEFWYFDPPSANWLITVAGRDINGAQNTTSTTYTVNQLTAVVLGPANMTWPSLALGAVNQSSTNPLLVNNTGNANITFVNLTAFDVSKSGGNDYIPAENFSVSSTQALSCWTGGGAANFTANATNVSLANVSVLRGNYSQADNLFGQRSLYLCLRQVPTTISAGRYASQRSWVLTIG